MLTRDHIAVLPVAVLAPALAATLVAAETVTGAARVVDADTLVVAGVRVRLLGIDAPKLR